MRDKEEREDDVEQLLLLFYLLSLVSLEIY